MGSGLDIVWPHEDCTRVPFELFFDQGLYQIELDRIFSGAHWQYLALDEEIPRAGDYTTTYLGERRVVVTRGPDNQIYAFENRCAHRGAQVVNRIRGNAAKFNCPYHLWCYDHAGNLIAVSQQKGVKGKGGMPDDFELTGRGMRKLKIARYRSLIFGTFAGEIMPLEDYIGPASLQQIDRIMSRPVRVLGYYRQVVEANWKLYAENTRDPYHAPLLHLFHVTFGIQTPAMKGGSYMDAEKKNNCILVTAHPDDSKAHDLLVDQYRTNDKYRSGYRLKDPRILGTKRSFDDDTNVMINTIFPSLVVAQVENAFQIRHSGPEAWKSSSSSGRISVSLTAMTVKRRTNSAWRT